MLQVLPEMGLMARMRLKEKLPWLMEQKGIKPAELSKMTGIPAPRFSEWKDPKGKRSPTLEQAKRIARALGVSLDYLADDSLDEPPNPELNAEDREILRIARRLGYEQALDRLINNETPGVSEDATPIDPRRDGRRA